MIYNVMANHWGLRSLEVRKDLHPDLIKVLDTALVIVDMSLIEGHRNKKRQDFLYPKFTKVKWPNSRHNTFPSEAVDITPSPFRGYPDRQDPDYPKELARWYALASVISAVGHLLNIPIRTGADWDRDWTYTDQDFDDLGHIELLRR